MIDAANAQTRSKPWWPDIFGYGWWLLGVLALLYVYPLIEEYFTPISAAAHPAQGGDFINLWSAARLVSAGEIMSLFDLDKFQALQEKTFGPLSSVYNWSYPPFFIPLIAVFHLLPYGAALTGWLVTTFMAYAAAVAMGRKRLFALAGVLLLAPSSFLTVVHGQNSFLTGALLVGGLRLMEGQPRLAGFLFGLLTFKPHLGLLIPVAAVVRRRWMTLIIAAIVTVFLVAGSILLYGFEPWHGYFTVVYPHQRDLLESCAQALCGAMWPTGFTAVRLLGGSFNIAYGVTICLAGFAAVCVTLAWRRPVAGFSVAISLTAATVASPYLNNYDLTLTSAAIIILLTEVERRHVSPLLLGLMAMVWLLPVFVVMTNAAHVPVAPVLLLAFLVEQMRCLRRVQATGASVPK